MPSKLIARGPLYYNTRRMRAGDEFEAASDGDVLFLTTTGLAKKKENESRSENVQPAVPSANRGDLAREYEALAGRRADRRWRNPRLLYEIGKLRS